MTRLAPILTLALLLLAGCSSDDDGDDGTTTTTSASGSVSASAGPGVATAIEITDAPDSAPAGSLATVCWLVSGTGNVPHVAIHWDNTSHAVEPTRTFQAYDLGVSYPNNQTSAASGGYDLDAEGARFCTAATMPSSGSIFVVAHVIDSTGAPGRLSSEREIEAESAGSPKINIRNFAYSPLVLTVTPGASVAVENHDSATHTVTGEGFDTGDVAGGQTGSFTAPMQAGSYPFTCPYHSAMRGTLEVRTG